MRFLVLEMAFNVSVPKSLNCEMRNESANQESMKMTSVAWATTVSFGHLDLWSTAAKGLVPFLTFLGMFEFSKLFKTHV